MDKATFEDFIEAVGAIESSGDLTKMEALEEQWRREKIEEEEQFRKILQRGVEQPG